MLICFHGCSMPSGRPSDCCNLRRAVKLAVIMGGLWTVGSVDFCVTDLQGSFQSVGSVALHAAEPLGRSSDCGISCPGALCAAELLG